MLPSTKGPAVIALDRLQGRQSHVGAQGARAPSAPSSSRRQRRTSSTRAAAIVVPGVGHFAATTALDAGVDRRDPRASRRRTAAARHLPRHAVAVRRQRGSAGAARARPAQRPLLSLCRPTTERCQGAARRLELARSSARGDSIVDGVADGAQVYFTHSYVAPVTGDTVAATDARRAIRVHRRSAATSRACSSIRKNPATSACRCCAIS